MAGWAAGVPRRCGGALDDPLDLVCGTCRLRAGERRESAAHMPPEHAVGSGLSPGSEVWKLATLCQCILHGAPPCHQTRPKAHAAMNSEGLQTSSREVMTQRHLSYNCKRGKVAWNGTLTQKINPANGSELCIILNVFAGERSRSSERHNTATIKHLYFTKQTRGPP